MTTYAVGLRATEAARLQVPDIDTSRMVIRIEQGKGGKDRYVMLSPQLLEILRVYWRLTKPGRWLLPVRWPRPDPPTDLGDRRSSSLRVPGR
ncbi:tyrosine-type recombinase/integrase [Mesorhizobium helmanticense]|uniref:tyrosine-type recombinase/integrase n=1 Tax=Mesorhizobium helmanticense TaxID=1776423 RepID=UPI003CC9572C